MIKSTVDAVGASMRNSKQKDDDCVSEDSFGSDFDNAVAIDEGDSGLKARLNGVDTELNSPPPVYSEGEHFQSTSLLANMDVKSLCIVLQYTSPTGPTELEPAFDVSPNLSGPSMCVVCKVSPTYSKDGVPYPTCRALECTSKVPIALIPENQIFPPQTSITPSSASPSKISYSVKQGSPNRQRGSANRQMEMCDVCHLRPRAQNAGGIYPACGLTCAAARALVKKTGPNLEGNAPTLDPYQSLSPSFHSSGIRQPRKQHQFYGHSQSLRGSTRTQTASTCVVCFVNPCRDGRFVTCGMKCTERLYMQGSSNWKMCDYCHRRPKSPGHDQCGKTCRDKACTACLLCRSRPRYGRYHFCGRTCKNIAYKWTPLILEVRPGHSTYNKVEQMFKRAWIGSGVPSIKKIYKIMENKSFLLPFDRHRRSVGNEVFRYHGTSRRCTLGSLGNTRPCPSTTCSLCSILRTSFKISQSGPFGAGVYTSFSANQAYKFSKGSKGAIILTKVVLGTVYDAKARHEVNSCPPGHNSVVYNPQAEKTTVVYTNDAIRPVFLLVF